MKRLFIVNATAALNGGAAKPTDLSGMADGSIGFYECDAAAWLAAAPKKDFAIVAGRGANNAAIVMPEVNLKTLKVVKAAYAAGTKLKKEFTIVAPADDLGVKVNNRLFFDYTVIVSVAGTKLNERVNYTYTERFPKSVLPKDVAAKIGKHFSNQFAEAGVDVKVTVAAEKVSFEAAKDDSIFNVTLTDALAPLAITTTAAVAACGTPEQILSLAKACAADAGYQYHEDRDIYPGYLADVAKGATYNLYTLSYSNVLHPAAHVMEESVNQVIHIAVPVGAASEEGIGKVLVTA